MATYEYNGLKINSEDVTVDDMPTEIFREIYELCGVDVALSLLINMCANIIQVPAKGLTNIIKRIILKDYDGSTASIRRISRRFAIPELQVRKILSDNKIQTPDEKQNSLPLIYSQK